MTPVTGGGIDRPASSASLSTATPSCPSASRDTTLPLFSLLHTIAIMLMRSPTHSHAVANAPTAQAHIASRAHLGRKRQTTRAQSIFTEDSKNFTQRRSNTERRGVRHSPRQGLDPAAAGSGCNRASSWSTRRRCASSSRRAARGLHGPRMKNTSTRKTTWPATHTHHHRFHSSGEAC